MRVERLVFWESLCSATRLVCRKWIALLDDCRKQKWIWVILLAFASYKSYFVRALLAALFFFTILYVVLVALTALYVLMAHALYCGILWAASVGDSFHSLLQHHVASPARVPGLSEGQQSARIATEFIALPQTSREIQATPKPRCAPLS